MARGPVTSPYGKILRLRKGENQHSLYVRQTNEFRKNLRKLEGK